MQRLGALSFCVSAIAGTAAACGLSVTGEAPGKTDGVMDAAVHDAPSVVRDAAAERVEAATPVDSGCPSKNGPTMVSVGTFCVDSTEVTQAQYAEFLAAGVSPTLQPAYCAWNVGNVAGKTFVPSGQWPPMPMTETDPVTSVNWCDAYAYCAWAGKRLCGQIGGGPLAQGSADDTGASQWFYACSQQGQRAYPYGHNYVPTACNGNAANVAPVATFPQCVGGYPGIFDMSGNVREWEDSCSGAAGMGDMCNERGGSVNDQGAGLACATSDFAARTDSNVHLGFRCCAP